MVENQFVFNGIPPGNETNELTTIDILNQIQYGVCLECVCISNQIHHSEMALKYEKMKGERHFSSSLNTLGHNWMFLSVWPFRSLDGVIIK